MFGTGDRITYASGDPAEVWDGGIVRAIDAELDNGFYVLTEIPFVTAMSEVIANNLVGDHGFWVYPYDADMAADLLNESLPS